MSEFFSYLLQESAGNYYFFVFPLAVIALFFLLKKRRMINFLVPVVLITIVVFNPLFYYIWDKLGLYAYWRILWIIPVIPVLAVLGAALCEKTKKKYLKIVITIVFTIFLVLIGSFVYSGKEGKFTIPATNFSKVPQGVADVADYILTQKENPRIIAESSISTYIRQYTGKIDTLYGRDVNGYILRASSEARDVSNELESLIEEITISEDASLNDLYNGKDMSAVADVMLNDCYDFLVLNEVSEKLLDQLQDSGFELVKNISGYSIYSVNGNPTVIKERNKLGQVISETYIDEDGKPVVNDNGYTTVLYDYNQDGNVSRVFYTDANGNGVLDNNKRAGYEREYDRQDHVIMERNIDQNGNPIIAGNHYAEMRREYTGKYWTKLSYFDTEGHLLNNIYGYASTERQLDDKGNVIRQVYYGEDGNKIITGYGYAEIRREYNDKEIVKEAYYGTNSALINGKDGYAYVINALENNIEMHRYYDTTGKLTISSYGYAIVKRELDENGNIIKEVFFDTDEKPLVTKAGYAGYIQSFDENNTLLSKTYIGEDEYEILRTDGYSKAKWDKTGDVYNLHIYDLDGKEVSLEGINLAKGVKDDWSEWITPKYNVLNSTGNFGNVNLGEKNVGDYYTCQIEIEFKDVVKTPNADFCFRTQGSQDGKWGSGNVWNSKLVNLTEVPENGVYTFNSTVKVTEKMIKASNFNLGFRCDNWAGGSFRVKNIKVEVGDETTEWTPGV